jgi:hypothetical protein
MGPLRRSISTIRYVNDELLRAGEAIIRSSRAPQPPPRPDVAAGTRAQSASVTGRDGQAA